MEPVTAQIRDFLQFITLQFISHPEQAQLKIAEADDNHIRYRLILHHDDVKHMIGRNGFTASSIRNLMKGASMKSNLHVTLQIISHEEEAQRIEKIEQGVPVELDSPRSTIDETHDEELEG